MRTVIIAISLFLFAWISFAEDTRFLSYRWSGGYSPYKETTVTINTSGVTRVTGQKLGLPPINYQTLLTSEELATVRALVKSTEFFSQPEQDSGFATDVGTTELIIDSDGETRSLSYSYRPSLKPLTHLVWKLITQATAIETIKNDGDIYTATGAVKPTHVGMKALQPDRVKPHFMSYIQSHEDRQKVEWALEALASITTPEEFCGFVALGLEDQKQRNTLLSIIGTHPFYGNIPESHLAALCPVYLTFARDASQRADRLGEIDKQALSAFTRLLGVTRYEPSIPMFASRFEKHKEPYVTTSITPLASMGRAGVSVLAPYLDSPEEALRLNAIELLTIASRTGPHCGFANPLSESEYRRMIPIFTQTIVPTLHILSKDDASEKVRKKATEAVKEIEHWINKERIPTSASTATNQSAPLCVTN